MIRGEETHRQRTLIAADPGERSRPQRGIADDVGAVKDATVAFNVDTTPQRRDALTQSGYAAATESRYGGTRLVYKGSIWALRRNVVPPW